VTHPTLSLLKYHGAGNDFLIALDPSALPAGPGGEIDAGTVRALCDRRRGIGADGLIVRRAPEGEPNAHVAMELWNADGSAAETSGNGLRCFALALVDEGFVPPGQVLIQTGGGLAEADVPAPSGSCGSGAVRVSMGRASIGASLDPSPFPRAGFAGWPVDTGNPHLVLLGGSIDDIDVSEVGPKLELARPGGQNVEIVAPDGSGGLDLVVWERGAGRTEACGSGSCAAAAVGRAAGVVGDHVEVHNPGGTLTVDLEGPLDCPAITLGGPAVRVAQIEVGAR
jgi:diaminopimelate epimerase